MTTKYLGGLGDDFVPYCEGEMTAEEQFAVLEIGAVFRITGSDLMYQKLSDELCAQGMKDDNGDFFLIGDLQSFLVMNPMQQDLEAFAPALDTAMAEAEFASQDVHDPTDGAIRNLSDLLRSRFLSLPNASDRNLGEPSPFSLN